MEKSNQRIAVGNGAAQGNLAGGAQRTVQIERAQTVAVIGHQAGESTVAAKNQAPEFTRGLTARDLRRTAPEIKPGPNVECRVGTPIVQSLPPRVFVEWVRHTIQDQVVQPELTAAVVMFQHVEQ